MPAGVALNAVQEQPATYEQFQQLMAGTLRIDNMMDSDPITRALNSGDTASSHLSSAGNSISSVISREFNQ